MDLTRHGEPWGPAPAELGTGRALPSLPARQGQAGPGRGKACAPQQAASTGLGSRQGKPGPERHSPPESGDRDRGRAGGSVPLQGKDKEETATKPGTFIYGRVNRAGLGPNDHGARAGGIVERRRQKKQALCTTPARLHRARNSPPPASAPFPVPTQGEASDTHPTLPSHPAAQRQAHGTLCPRSRCCPNITTPPARFCQCHQLPLTCCVRDTTAQLSIPSSVPATPSRSCPGHAAP